MIEQSQMEKIQEFVKKSGIRYYDLELEMADHISAWISADMEKNHCSFESSYSLLPEYFSSPEMKFIQESRKEYLYKKYKKIFLLEWGTFFSWPKISFLIVLFALVTFLDGILSNDALISTLPQIIYISYYLTSLFYAFNLQYKIANKTNITKKLLTWNTVKKWHDQLSFPVILWIIIFFISTWKDFKLAPHIPILLFKMIFYSWPLQITYLWSIRKTRVNCQIQIMKDYPEAFQLANSLLI